VSHLPGGWGSEPVGGVRSFPERVTCAGARGILRAWRRTAGRARGVRRPIRPGRASA
jgi:hypothetical protein